jgi:signal transduction histidine kinase/DNA-binding response OmpR family regulator/Fe-S-cluster-containing dehydrogenase component
MELANITFQDDFDDIKVEIDHEKCILCGRCVTACHHNARYYEDDTERFFEDLSNGIPISLIVAPAIRTNMPEYKRLFTYLKKQGVNKIYDVSAGADICIWAHTRYLNKTNFAPIITQPCPTIVLYCKIYQHDLLKYLSPIHSPMACTSIYQRKYNNTTDRFALISPCVSKIDEYSDTGIAEYNVTFAKLIKYLEENNIKLPDEETPYDYEESSLGSLFPTPGGLKENIEYVIGKNIYVTTGEGYSIYERLNNYKKLPDDQKPVIYDVLNCVDGCNIGTACTEGQNIFDIDKKMHDMRIAAAEKQPVEYFKKLYKDYDKRFDLTDFIREYEPINVIIPEISDASIENAFMLLGKVDFESRRVDCYACGSETCYDMARRIALSVNIPVNCIVKSVEDVKIEHDNFVIANERLKSAINVASETNRTKSEFLASMSHEIKTPMNAIIGMLELLEHDNLTAQQMRFVEDISLSAHSLLDIINNVLDMSKIESKSMELNLVDYSLHQLIDNISSVFTYIAFDKNLLFKLEMASDVPDYLHGDDVRIRQILTNICGNAVKFTDEGFIRLTVTCDEEFITFKVEDTGIGITKASLAIVFNPFEQVDEVRNRNIVGMGLGLSISKSYVELMGGTIVVESDYGFGSTVTVKIPINVGDTNTTQRNTSELTLSAPDAKVLVTDDNEFNLKVAAGLLKLMDIVADTADNGYRAIDLVKKNDYDMVFMDHMMPDIDGVETVKIIRNLEGDKYKDLPIIALTANTLKSAQDMFLANGFNDYVAKPIDTDILRNIIKKYLPKEKVKIADVSENEQERSDKIDEMLKKTTITFVKENQKTWEKLCLAINSKDMLTARRIVHSVKGSAGYLGKKELRAAAYSLEQAFMKEPYVYTKKQISTFERELNLALKEYEYLLIEALAEKPKGETIGVNALVTLFSKVEPLLRDGDFSANDYVDEFQKIDGLEKLADLIDNYEYESALQELMTIKNKNIKN